MYPAVVVLWGWLLPSLCYGFVLLSSSAAAGAGAEAEGRVFAVGSEHSYRLESTVLLNEAGAGARLGKDVGFQISAGIQVGCVWQASDKPDSKLLKIQLTSPQLHIKSRKAPAPEGFVVHTSQLETTTNSPFLVHWERGFINHVFIAQGEDLSMVNLKKGIASLFQFQLKATETIEKDASGRCIAKYTPVDSHSFLKTKSNCLSGKSVPYIHNPNRVLSTEVSSKRSTKYIFSKDLRVVESVTTAEAHEMVVILRQDAGSSVKASQELKRTDGPITIPIVTANSVEDAVKDLEKSLKNKFNRQILVTDREPPTCQEECPSLTKLVKENREYLTDQHLGTIRSATAFTKLVSAARLARKEEIVKLLKSSKNKDILPQLCDLIGVVQTQAAHDAAMKVLHLEADSDLLQNERYFQSLSFGSHPLPQVVKDVMKRSEKTYPNEKMAETLVLTAAAMASRLKKQQILNVSNKVVDEVKASLMDGLEACKTEECKQMYLRGLKNLGFQETVPVLLQHALNGSRKTSVAAMKALRSLPPKYWDQTVKKAAHKIYYQLDKRYDSSSRTLAIDILLESRPSQEQLQDLVLSLASMDPAYEVKQYLKQRLQQISDQDATFNAMVEDIKQQNNLTLNNYNIVPLRGLSTALTRTFLNNPSGNGSLITVQEISSGLLKRGIVDIVLENSGDSQTIFSLGLFAGGLGSFISSDEDVSDSADEAEEAATAGMELTALGVQIRPFVFFNGQGELMGHVWSGTGSERTPAFQILALLQDHLQYLPLQTGFIAELSLLGTLSFDLSGQVQLSLWNRNAHLLVEKKAGLLLQGLLKVDTSFVRSQVEFNIATEASLNLVSDINFYNNVALCLQLSQPDSIIKHNIHKVERIPGSKHRLRKSKYKVIQNAGKTYALNKKNNEMCNVIHSE